MVGGSGEGGVEEESRAGVWTLVVVVVVVVGILEFGWEVESGGAVGGAIGREGWEGVFGRKRCGAREVPVGADVAWLLHPGCRVEGSHVHVHVHPSTTIAKPILMLRTPLSSCGIILRPLPLLRPPHRLLRRVEAGDVLAHAARTRGLFAGAFQLFASCKYNKQGVSRSRSTFLLQWKECLSLKTYCTHHKPPVSSQLVHQYPPALATPDGLLPAPP